jgi:hypothetical protein
LGFCRIRTVFELSRRIGLHAPFDCRTAGGPRPFSNEAGPAVARTVLLTVVAMLAFAANTLFGCVAMGDGLIDPASYAAGRTISGALALCLIAWSRWRARGRNLANWRIALMLFTYMIFFAFAYLTMTAGRGP